MSGEFCRGKCFALALRINCHSDLFAQLTYAFDTCMCLVVSCGYTMHRPFSGSKAAFIINRQLNRKPV